ncbi:MAG: PLP-dependent aminotransferase family protein [Magnetospirillum sp.]|nr:PLP-dependent aminotransferase family protein [Magnetospirillum sp.]
MDWSERFSPYGRRAKASEIRELLKLLDQPDIISFAGGIPDPKLFPRQLMADVHAEIFADEALSNQALQYSVSEGYGPLRDLLVAEMKSLGITCTKDNIVITNGSQQGLDLLGRLFIGPDDKVLVARPTYLGLLQAFTASGPTYGDIAALTGPAPVRAKLAYAMPDFQNPSGETMTLAEREALLEGARRSDLMVIEDTAYNKLSFDGPLLPSLMELDIAREGDIENSRVIYCGTFSKSVVPGLRVGWIVAATPIVQKLVLMKQASDLHTSTLAQMTLAKVMECLPAHHADTLCDTYRPRRDAMVQALEEFMPEGVTFTRPGGGMFIWVELPEGFDGAALLARAIAEERVAFVPGSAFYATQPKLNTLRLSFSATAPEKIREGIRRLGALIAREHNGMSRAATA